jgi:dCMP deaminase
MNHWQTRFIKLAEFIADWSKDPSTKVGAIITDADNRIISMGFNGLPKRVSDSSERLTNRDIKYRMIVHAEINAMLFAKQDLYGYIIYTYPFMPCAQCAAAIIQSGILHCVAPKNDNPRWQSDFEITRQMFSEAGITLTLV